jgi:hypothetical protein
MSTLTDGIPLSCWVVINGIMELTLADEKMDRGNTFSSVYIEKRM